MRIIWVDETAGFHSARLSLGWPGTVHLTVESLDRGGWDWNVWEASRWGEQYYGLASTINEAKAKAEWVLEALTRQLSSSVGTYKHPSAASFPLAFAHEAGITIRP